MNHVDKFLEECRQRGIEVTEGPRKPVDQLNYSLDKDVTSKVSPKQVVPSTRLHVLWIPGWRPATCNQLIRFTVGQRIRLAKFDREMVAHYAKAQAIPFAVGCSDFPSRKRRVSLEIVLEGRQREADADAYWKSTLDSCVACGLLRGDRNDDVEIGTVKYSRFGQAGTRILFQELDA